MSDPVVPRLIHYHYCRPGKSVTIYDEWLVVDRPDVKVLLLDEYAGKTVSIGGKVVLDAGAPIVWYVFPGAWHDVGRFHLKDGTFTGWYTNLTTPVVFAEPVDWTSTDLFLDLWTPVAGDSLWLDENEFASALRRGVIDKATQMRVVQERLIITALLAAGSWPPTIARNIDLAKARSLK